MATSHITLNYFAANGSNLTPAPHYTLSRCGRHKC